MNAKGGYIEAAARDSRPIAETVGTSEQTMRLKVLLPYRVLTDEHGVTRIIVMTRSGAFGLLPHRLDCTAAIVPGILAYRFSTGEPIYLAVDDGVLVKTGSDVVVSVRNAIGGQDLGALRAAVERECLNLDERERNVRTLIARLESDFVRRFLEMQRGR
jgi:F-type H+-transporting ATPase subunit epsilon